MVTTVVVDEYVQQEHRWPESWTALQKVANVKSPSCYNWPADAEKLQQLVSIKFDTNLKDVASQTIEQFDAITLRGPSYPYNNRGHIKTLINLARQVMSVENDPSK